MVDFLLIAVVILNDFVDEEGAAFSCFEFLVRLCCGLLAGTGLGAGVDGGDVGELDLDGVGSLCGLLENDGLVVLVVIVVIVAAVEPLAGCDSGDDECSYSCEDKDFFHDVLLF